MTARSAVRWAWIPVGIVCLYTAWVFYARYADQQRIEREAQERRATADKEILDKIGSGLKIQMFYANPPIVGAGERFLLCYGVSDADSVRIEPAVDGVAPALSRCVESRVRKTTTFRLVAADKAGKSVEQSIEVRVR